MRHRSRIRSIVSDKDLKTLQRQNVHYDIKWAKDKIICERCGKSVLETFPCERCDVNICSNCLASFNQFTQIDYNRCKSCIDNGRDEDV